MFEELRQSSGEGCFLHYRLHFAANAFYFSESECVDILWWQGGSGKSSREKPVKFFSIWHLPDAHLIETCRQVLLAEECFKLAIGREDYFLDGFTSTIAQFLTVRLT